MVHEPRFGDDDRMGSMPTKRSKWSQARELVLIVMAVERRALQIICRWRRGMATAHNLAMDRCLNEFSPRGRNLSDVTNRRASKNLNGWSQR